MEARNRRFKERHLCVARPSRKGWLLWDPKLKRQVRQKPWPNGSPLIGYLCESCNKFNNFEKMFLVDGKAMHESCAMGKPRQFTE